MMTSKVEVGRDALGQGSSRAHRGGLRRSLGPARLAPVMLVVLALFIAGCTRRPPAAVTEQSIGVLLVSHGSLSETWRRALTDLDARIRGAILQDPRVKDVKSAFMEYTEPSIATRMKELDAAGISDVVVVPVFLTVSPHPFDDIPTILGQKTDPQSLETLKLEGIERYTPRARVHFTPLLDFTDLLQKNLLRRAKSLSTEPSKEGLVLVAYGDTTYEKEWDALLERSATHVEAATGIGAHAHAWCGHIVHYDPAKTTEAIQKVLAVRERAIVVPVLVAHDERFQVKLIGSAIAKLGADADRVAYRPDAILPDDDLDEWIKSAARELVEKVAQVEPKPTP